MRRKLLFTLMAALSLAAQAVTPKGTPSCYEMAGYFYTWLGVMYSEGVVTTIYEDGKDVYIPLFPIYSDTLYLKGTLSEDGNTLTFPKDSIVAEDANFTYSVSDYYYDDPENDSIPSDTIEVVLHKEGDNYYFDDDVDAPQHYLMLVAHKGDTIVGEYALVAAVYFSKMVEVPQMAQIPASAVKKAYTYRGEDIYGEPSVVLGNVYFDGNDVYFDHFAGLECVIKGTIQGDSVIIAKDQYLGVKNLYHVYSGSYETLWEVNEDEEYIGTLHDAFKLGYDASTGTFSCSDTTIYQVALDRYYNLSGALCNISIEFYEGDKPAVPSDPMNVVLQDYTLFAGCFCLSGYIGNWDINGKYINPDKIEVAVLEDGDYLTLSADDGYNIDEDIVWMPWSFSDNKGGENLSIYYGSTYLYLYESLFEKLGLQSRYTVDGVTYYSNIVYVDVEDNLEVVEVNHSTGEPVADAIAAVSTRQQAKRVFNLYGQRLNKIQRGLNVIDGKALIAK